MWEDIRNQIDPTIAAVSSMLILLPVVWLVALEIGRGLQRVKSASTRPVGYDPATTPERGSSSPGRL